MTDKKRRTISTLVTVLVHTIVLVLMMLITMHLAKPDVTEDGVPVLLGNVEDAAGQDENGLPDNSSEKNEKVDVEQENIPESNSSSSKIAEPTPQITQEKEPSIYSKKNKKETELKDKAEADAKAKAEREAKLKAEADAKAKAEREAKLKAEAEKQKRQAAVNSRVSGAFGKGGKTGDSGNGQDSGNQGSPTGNSNTGNVHGVGGTGNASAKVGSRTVKVLAKPSYDDPTSEGHVVVSIVVNAQGQVVSASIKSFTTTSSVLQAAALKAARSSSFSTGETNENGTITYVFKQR